MSFSRRTPSRPNLSRRGFLGLVGATGAAAALASCGLGGVAGQTADLLPSRAPLPKPFRVPLPIPPVKRPTRSDGTTDYYEIVQQAGVAEILPGLRTPILGYDGIFPGPTLVTRSGRRTVVRHRNELPVPVAVHLHGGHTPADSDGYPTDLLLPVKGWKPPAHQGHGGSSMLGRVTKGERDYVYPMRQRAATLWYHDHRMDFTGPQVYRGLAGFHLVHDDEEAALPLPEGDRDIPLMICDRSFEADGAFRYPSLDRTLQSTPGVLADYMEGILGDVILVNGAPWPELEVEAARYRFRILNASNARRYRLALTPAPNEGPGFVQVGADGGLLERPVEHDAIEIAPAERFDVVVDFSAYKPGTEVTLTNGLGGGQTSQVMRFRVTRKVKDDSRVPDRLSRIERLDPAKAVRTREWHFRRGAPQGDPSGIGGSNVHWTINNKDFDPKRMDAAPKLGQIEIWRFISDLHHPVHIHLDPFQVIKRGGGAPGVYDAGWKDTVDVRPAEYVDVAVRFTDYRGAYMLHCHNLEHEDMAMMAAYETV
ncbi:multicopper oxidase family protein [Actinopolymorpha alba]|uniref:multicopper oxidase family protein n=1 Tax=Actinopolymorpha alba TaxID=533267 RepID=UPI0003620884|nr:multicopper oxidase domain-containing protein [Actinopolymorpha alba]